MTFDLRRCTIIVSSLLVGIGGTTVAFAAPPRAVSSASAEPGTVALALPVPCDAEYRALLDMANLARRYGPAARIFLDPLGDMFDRLGERLSAPPKPAWLPQTNIGASRVAGFLTTPTAIARG